MHDGRRSITRIEQAITDLERNPQRIITGGEGKVRVRQYDGRSAALTFAPNGVGTARQIEVEIFGRLSADKCVPPSHRE